MKSLQESITNEGRIGGALPVKNHLCPAQDERGNYGIIVGNPFTVDNYLSFKGAKEHAEAVYGRKALPFEAGDLNRVKDYLEELNGDAPEPGDEIVFVDIQGTSQLTLCMLFDWYPLVNK
jgi:hypothetical protein